ncbi:MAG: peptidase M48 [Chitinophagaceae bacterium]|nr:MAG: peptidase M48 [Chitinophagaceae bacterium]
MLHALPYHQKVKEYFKAQSKTWDYFSTAKTKEGQLDQFKKELLKNTYKFDPTTDAFIYEKIDIAKEKLELQSLPVTVYQAQYTDELNASILYFEKEAHIVFSGSVTRLLDEEELLAILAHELTHVKLFSMLEGDLEVTDRIITAIANNYNTEASHFETARRFRLYTEIFCDRGAYSVLGKTGPIISSLVKISTGLDKVNPENYLKQADEIFATEAEVKTAGVSHPENFIRARAIQLWSEKGEGSEEAIIRSIEGKTDIDQLDIFSQKEIANTTRQLLQLFLKPKWFQSSMVLSQAKQYFPDFFMEEKSLLTPEFVENIKASHKSLKDYLAYVMYDFVMVDPSLEEIPGGWAFQFAEDLALIEVYDAMIKKEMKFSDKKLATYREKVLAAYYEVKEGQTEQIYED